MADRNHTLYENFTGIKDMEFEQPVVNIGCHPDNDVTITGTGILPFHATILAQAEGYRLVTMAPGASILVDGSPLLNDDISLTENQRVEIGTYTLKVRRNGSTTGMHIAVAQTSQPLETFIQPTAGLENAILVNLLSQISDIVVQQTAVYQLEVINAGPIVASFQAVVSGVPAEWVVVKPAVINLNESQRATFEVSITPPRAPTSSAGKHPVSIVVTSPNYPGQLNETLVDLIIQPYYEFSLGGLSPRQVHIPWTRHTGKVRMPVTNLGNSDADLTVSGVDEENGLSFDFTVREGVELNRQAVLSVPAGQTTTLPIEITPLKHPIAALRSKRYHYTTSVQAADPSVAPQILSGSAVASPLFGWWVILLAVLGVLAGLFLLLQPRINYFQVAAGKDVIELGDSTALEWSVSPFATRLSISGTDKAITRGQNSLTVTPAKSTTYEMVSGNWLSGMLGLDRKASLTVLTVPPSPDINVFEVDRTQVDKGNPVNLRWSVTRADQAFLTIDEVVYELTPEKFSGEQAVVLEKDAIVSLEAKSASGSELRSYFINVVLPHIDVLKFTVWVRPLAAGQITAPALAAASAGGHRAALRQQDTDFSEKLVELIPDASSDTGYRVEFYQPDRELAKGEQIMLQWEVDGVETVQIAPFTEVLPANGIQPFFPQESMNFVLTAKSGDLEQLFMLPVKVFDGEPPKAPTIEFFTASPSKRVGPGDIQFAWSVTGEWTRVQLSSGEEIVADNLFAQGFHTTPVAETSSFILTAWNGSLSSAKIIEVTIDPTLLKPKLTITDIYPHAGYFRVGDAVNVFISIKGVAGNPDPTGTVIISDGFSICTVVLPTVSCQPPLIFKTPGVKKIKASYGGDKIYAPVDSAVYTKEKIIVEANQVTLSPAYFYSEKGVKKDPIASLSTANLKVGDGLWIDVSVIPENKTLTDDKKSQVTVRYCPLTAKGNIIDSECVSAGPATVTLPAAGADASASIGHAELSINHLRKAGTFALLISYTHLDGAFEPVLIGDTADTRILLTVGKGVLLLIPQSTTPCTYEYCLLHQANPADVVFDAKLMLNEYDPNTLDDDVMVDLFPTFPLPGNLDLTVTKKIDGTPLPAWTPNCAWQVNGSIHQLFCNDIDLSQDIEVRYLFLTPDANYTIYPKALPITVEVKEATEIVMNSTMFNNTYVGTIIELQKGNVYLREAVSKNALVGPVNMTVTIDGANIAEKLLKVDGSCVLDPNNGLILTQGADYTTDTCRVAFKKAGDYLLVFTFDGNADFDASQKTKSMTAAKQTGIVIKWQNNDISGNYQVFTYINTELDITCPSGTNPSCANFSTLVLTGVEIQFDLSAADSCKVYNDVTEVANGKFTLPAPNGTGQVLVSNVRFRCTTLGAKAFKVGFVSPSPSDYGINSGSQKNPTLVKYDTPMSPTIRRNDGTSLATYPLIGSPSDDITSSEWFVGVEYWVKVDLTGMPDDATPDATDKVKMVWPIALNDALDLDPAVSDCLVYYKTGSDPAEYNIPFEKSGTTWTAKCKFKFSSTHSLQPNDTIAFSLQSSRFNNTNSDNTIDLPNAVSKRQATLEPEIRQNDGTSLDTYPVVGSPSNEITSDEAKVGIEYWVVVKLNNMPSDFTPTSSDLVKLVMPISLKNAMDPDKNKSTCLNYYKASSDPAEFNIPVEKVDTTWTAKCKYIFSGTAALQPNDVLRFSLVSNWFSASDQTIALPDGVGKRTVTIAPEIRLNDGSSLANYPVKGSPTVNITHLWVGEEYWAVAEIASMTDQPDSSDVARMVWVSNLTSGLDLAKSTCDAYASGDTYNIPFNKDGNKWVASCKFVFSSEKTLNAADKMTFTLVSNRFSDTTTYNINLPDEGIKKMPVTITISVINGAVKTADTAWYALSDPRIQVVLSEFETHYQGDLNTGLTCTSGFLTVTSKIGTNAATNLTDCQKTVTGTGTATFTYALSDDKAYTAVITASYANTANVFADSSATKTITIAQIPVSISLNDLVWTDSSGNEHPFPETIDCATCDTWTPIVFIANRNYSASISVTATAPVGSEPTVTQGKVKLSLLHTAEGWGSSFEGNVVDGVATITGITPNYNPGWLYTGYSVEFYNADAFETASDTSDTDVRQKIWQLFALEDWSAPDGFKVVDTANGMCFDVYLELDSNDADVAQCEGQSCWFRVADEKVAIECGGVTGYNGDANDRFINTDMNFQPQDATYKFQLYILNGLYVGYIKQGWPYP